MSVVVDTNVFVGAAFNSGSASARLLREVRNGRLALVWDEPTRAETRAVLGRIPRISWHEMSGLFREQHRHAGSVRPQDFARISDPNDRKFAVLAAAAGCALVSSDEHLLEHRGRLGIDILTPRAFMECHG